ncbi:DUF6415 family natural product biosynthesis protein [Streptomyces meridianus]|uniref:DUF6415 family natural product biosynthesis protein n=1 Tax=Streptomyces meridianus TaxID=2938945 RepID=A0ABT0XDP6_9ACTN|nr:DUF6415 family natural product biosynthesis protein [Streptomyces meridianus]MCM2580648.1 DUF6415 family natural product biosynthesis protein [Streptomyces meridianus]
MAQPITDMSGGLMETTKPASEQAFSRTREEGTGGAPRADLDALPIDAATIRASVERAATVTAVLPQYQDLVTLAQLLRGHLHLLLPDAQADTDRLNRGTALWHQRQTTIDRTRRTLAEGMGHGLLSAAMHVQELGRACGFLLSWHGESR